MNLYIYIYIASGGGSSFVGGWPSLRHSWFDGKLGCFVGHHKPSWLRASWDALGTHWLDGLTWELAWNPCLVFFFLFFSSFQNHLSWFDRLQSFPRSVPLRWGSGALKGSRGQEVKRSRGLIRDQGMDWLGRPVSQSVLVWILTPTSYQLPILSPAWTEWMKLLPPSIHPSIHPSLWR